MGLIIKEIINEKRIKITELSAKLGLTRQNVYATFARVNIPDGELTFWANALGVTREEIMERANKETASKPDYSFGEETLKHIQSLLETELREKNEQIKALQEALKESQSLLKESQSLSRVLVGKYRGYPRQSVRPTTNGAIA